jgi:hypothetical protein
LRLDWLARNPAQGMKAGFDAARKKYKQIHTPDRGWLAPGWLPFERFGGGKNQEEKNVNYFDEAVVGSGRTFWASDKKMEPQDGALYFY